MTGTDANGVSDLSDESSCTNRTCQVSEFKCSNNRCIPKEWVCDRQNDCGDTSDEVNCRGRVEFFIRNHFIRNMSPRRKVRPKKGKILGVIQIFKKIEAQNFLPKATGKEAYNLKGKKWEKIYKK